MKNIMFRELLDSIKQMKDMQRASEVFEEIAIAGIRVNDKLYMSGELMGKANVSKTFGDFIKLMRTNDVDDIERLKDWWTQYQWEKSRG